MFEIVGVTDRGTDKPVNEDRVVMGGAVMSGGSLRIVSREPFDLAVFDGVSSGGQADQATTIATNLFCRATQADPGRPDLLLSEFGSINADIVSYRDAELPGQTAATTVGALSVEASGNVTALYAGDTRVYRLRDGRLEQLSHDHTIMQRLRDENALELLAGMAQQGAHVVTRALGRDDRNPVESNEAGMARPGDLYLLCSDGVVDGLLAAEPLHVQPEEYREGHPCADAGAQADAQPAGAGEEPAAAADPASSAAAADAGVAEAAADPDALDPAAGWPGDTTSDSGVVVTTAFPVAPSPSASADDDERHLARRLTRLLIADAPLLDRARSIVERALLSEESTDNVSVVLARCCEPGEEPAPQGR